MNAGAPTQRQERSQRQIQKQNPEQSQKRRRDAGATRNKFKTWRRDARLSARQARGSRSKFKTWRRDARLSARRAGTTKGNGESALQLLRLRGIGVRNTALR